MGALLLMAGVIASVGGRIWWARCFRRRASPIDGTDGLLPRWFGAVHPVYRTPIWSIVFFGGMCFSACRDGSFVWLAGLSVLTRILLYLGCIGAMPRLRIRFGDAPDSLRLPGGHAPASAVGDRSLGLLTQVRSNAYLVTAAFWLWAAPSISPLALRDEGVRWFPTTRAATRTSAPATVPRQGPGVDQPIRRIDHLGEAAAAGDVAFGDHPHRPRIASRRNDAHADLPRSARGFRGPADNGHVVGEQRDVDAPADGSLIDHDWRRERAAAVAGPRELHTPLSIRRRVPGHDDALTPGGDGRAVDRATGNAP